MMAQAVATRPVFPAVGQIFELTASEGITALSLLTYFFEYNPEGWQRSTGKTVAAGTTKRFKLMHVGFQENLAAVAKACTKPGQKVPEGAWIQVFDDTFGHNGVNTVGVADPSWVFSNDNAHFPMVSKDGSRSFEWDGYRRYGDGLWLVEVEAERLLDPEDMVE